MECTLSASELQVFHHVFKCGCLPSTVIWWHTAQTHFEPPPTFAVYWQGTRHMCFLCAAISHLILPIRRATLTEVSEVREQQGVWPATLPLGTGSGRENKRGSDKSSIYTSLAAGFDLNFSAVLTKANLWAAEATPNLEITTYGAFYTLNQTFINTLNKRKNQQLLMSSLPGDLQAHTDSLHIHHEIMF